MTSVIETGQARNLANLERLIDYCAAYGDQYNPINPLIRIPQMQALLQQARQALADLKEVEKQFNIATNERVTTFKDLNALSIRAVNALKATGTSALAVNDAKTILRKILGKRASDPALKVQDTSTAAPAARTISVAQLSYDNKLDNFSRLVLNLSKETLYTPNEPALQIRTLQQLATHMTQSNTNVIRATTALSNARIRRDVVLYQPVSGLVDIARTAKLYVKSLFGVTSSQYKQLTHLEFRPR